MRKVAFQQTKNRVLQAERTTFKTAIIALIPKTGIRSDKVQAYGHVTIHEECSDELNRKEKKNGSE